MKNKLNKALILSILTMALPAVLEMSLNTLLGVADTIMISQFIGKSALAAAGFANSIMFTLIFVFTSFNSGATALVARSYGEGDYDRLNRTASQTVLLNGGISLVIMALSLIFSVQLFSIFDTTIEVSNFIQDYFPIVAWSIPAMFLSFSYAAILRGAGDTVSPMVITGISNVINIIGNYVLIKGIWIFPEMGIAGAALSTTISRWIAVTAYTVICFGMHERVKLRLKDMAMQADILKPLIRISTPGAVEQALMQSSFLVLGVIVSRLDTVSEAAFRILINIESISFMPAVGLSIAAATLVGKSLGEKDEEKAYASGMTSALLATLWGGFMCIVFFVLREPILRAFTSDAAVIQASLGTMLLIAVNQPLLNFMIAMSGGLRGAGDTKAVMYITIGRLWLIFVPGSYFLIIRMATGIAGLWIAEIAAFLIFCVIIYRRFANREWMKIKLHD